MFHNNISMDNEPIISFIIPVYNVEKYLQKCLDSLVSQTLTQIEIICVDDCSTDSSYDILCKNADRDERIKVFRNPQNMRQGAARNLGVRHARGKYISYVDSDDWLDCNFAKDMYETASLTNADYIRGGCVQVYSDGSLFVEPQNHEQYQLQDKREVVLQHVCLKGGRVWGG